MESFWETDGWETEDRHLSHLREAPFQRQIPFKAEKPGLYVIRGPRQIGKSSLLKTCLSNWKRPKEAFYLSCENIRDHLDLAMVLKSLKGRKLILLDEISFVQGWDRAIKHELDRDSKRIFVLTGSNAVDIRKGIDQMPGRWGHGGEFPLLPMDFSEFQKMRVLAGWKKMDRLDELKLFFLVGGFPAALIEAGPKGVRPVQMMETLRRWIIGDVLKLGKQEIYARETLLQIAETLTSPISLQSLAQKTQMGSHHTAQEYVSILTDCFALKTLYAMDPETGAVRFKKNKKFYFTDPLIYWLALDIGGKKPPADAFEKLAEMTSHEYISRRAKRFGYCEDRRGEVDFICPSEWAIESKWSATASNLSKLFKDIRVPEKLVWTQTNLFEDAEQIFNP